MHITWSRLFGAFSNSHLSYFGFILIVLNQIGLNFGSTAHHFHHFPERFLFRTGKCSKIEIQFQLNRFEIFDSTYQSTSIPFDFLNWQIMRFHSNLKMLEIKWSRVRMSQIDNMSKHEVDFRIKHFHKKAIYMKISVKNFINNSNTLQWLENLIIKQ